MDCLVNEKRQLYCRLDYRSFENDMQIVLWRSNLGIRRLLELNTVCFNNYFIDKC